jgi:hypothetical protein
MTISQRVGIPLIASALVGAWALPAMATDLPVSPIHKVVRTATVKKPHRHHPIRLAADWPVSAGYRGGASYLVLGVGF